MTIGHRIRAFADDERGGYAVEFAIVGTVFLGLLLAILQYGLLFMARQSLDSTLQRATRSILTGAFQNSLTDLSDSTKVLQALRDQMCLAAAPNTLKVFDCSKVMLDVSVVGDFSSGTPTASAIDPKTGTWSTGFGTKFTCPKPTSIAVVRAALKYSSFGNPLTLGLGSFSDGSILLQSGVAFRVEQYQPSSTSKC